MGFYFTNILEIETSSLSLFHINNKNKIRLNLIINLHKEGKTNREITNHLISHNFKKRNKKDNYSIKDVFMCIKKIKIREKRQNYIKYKLGKWKLLREN